VLTQIKKRVRNIFIAGLLVTLPVAFTFFILNFLFKNIDDALSPSFTAMLIRLGAPVPADFRLPGVGVVMTMMIIFLAGLLTANIFGEKLLLLGEKIVEKIPVVRGLYSGAKQVVTAVLDANVNVFRKVVLVEFPRREIYAIGLITADSKGEIQAKTGGDVVNVFVPTTPNPTSGFLIFVPREQTIPLAMTVEDAVKFVLSGGILVPPYPGRHEQPRVESAAGADSSGKA
jgi:uncharacterized membrane protein